MPEHTLKKCKDLFWLLCAAGWNKKTMFSHLQLKDFYISCHLSIVFSLFFFFYVLSLSSPPCFSHLLFPFLSFPVPLL